MAWKKDNRRGPATGVQVLEEEHQALWLLNNVVGLGLKRVFKRSLLLPFVHLEWAENG